MERSITVKSEVDVISKSAIRKLCISVFTLVCGDSLLAEYLWQVIRVKIFRRPGDLIESCMPMEKQKALLGSIEDALDIGGEVVECGSFRGGGTIRMAITLKRAGSSKIVYGFDTFEGMPDHSPEDKMENGGIHYSKGTLAGTSLRLVKFKLRLFGVNRFVKFHKGFFEASVPQAFKAQDRFSLVLIDCDQYAGTKFCLEYFYDRVNPGGMIVIDDYFIPEDFDTPGVKIAIDEFMTHKPEKLQQMALSMYGFRKS